ncbi:phage holin family protein [Nocardioides sp.]|uniref:phage holin family protein n=1 Tax=Nocardioides sp. TaxID=35761 RepID=UPI002715D0C0|nr:phage holin family protein [Nocardioides sp.]MDO9456431.1 phage holin family protein [Nocardioides sp.]
MADPVRPSGAEPSTAELFTRLTDQSRQLVRDEIRLAQAETTQKVKHGIMGVAEFGVAGVLALYGVGLLLATIVLGLAEALPAWLAALIVTVVVFVIVGILALLGKKQVGEATPPAPEKAVAGIKQDVDTLKGNQS